MPAQRFFILKVCFIITPQAGVAKLGPRRRFAKAFLFVKRKPLGKEKPVASQILGKPVTNL